MTISLLTGIFSVLTVSYLPDFPLRKQTRLVLVSPVEARAARGALRRCFYFLPSSAHPASEGVIST